MFSVLHNIPKPTVAVKEFNRILKPRGKIIVVDTYAHADPRKDIDSPLARAYGYSMYYCLACSMNVPGSEAFGDCYGIERLEEVISQGGFTGVKNTKLTGEKDQSAECFYHLFYGDKE